jgi:tripartite-type tricarboxylate transporter receptor subunit TctC
MASLSDDAGVRKIFTRATLAHREPKNHRDRLSARMRSTFFMDSKGGAGGAIGAHEVVRAAPDGATLLATSNSLSILPALQRNLAFDPERDLVAGADIKPE